MALFFDTSALLKAYVKERRGSNVMVEILSHRRIWGEFFISNLTGLEIHSSLAKKLRESLLRKRRYTKARNDFLHDYENLFNVIPATEELIEKAIYLADLYRDHSIGSGDLIQLASVKWLISAGIIDEPVTFITADRRLYRVATKAGLVVFNPERDDLSSLVLWTDSPYSIDLHIVAGGD